MVELADQGMSAPLISRTLASQGYPPLDVGPVEIPEPTVRKHVSRVRKQRAGETFSDLSRSSDDYAVEQLRRRVITIADRETQRLARQQPSGKLDAPRLLAMAKVVKELRLTNRAAAPATKPPTKGKGDQAAEPADDFMRTLADDVDQPASDPPPIQEKSTDHAGPASATTNDQATTHPRPDPILRAREDRSPSLLTIGKHADPA